jgi:hypothetical protein
MHRAELTYIHSLISRGTDFGDGSLYTSYRNVSSWYFCDTFYLAEHDERTASYLERYWRTWCSAGRMDGGVAYPRPSWYPRNLNW